MGRNKKPIELLTREGKTHLTKAEIEKRRNEELKVDYKNVEAPSYLDKKQKQEFNDISKKLVELGIMTELDEDTLARYLVAQHQYIKYTSMMSKAMKSNNVLEMEEISKLQDRAFKQCRQGASDLGLTISSRCKLVVPKVEEPKKNKFSKFGK